MLLEALLGFLCGVTASVAGRAEAMLDPLPLLMVSFDGFRADYLQRFPMPNLKLLYSQGVLVEQLTNVFITKTFPNHYTLVTGLYAESHGILSSHMYDPVSRKFFEASVDRDSMWWSKAQPLWITALDSGYKTAAMMWPGSDVVISNRTATHFLPYNFKVTFQQRIESVTKWLLGDGKEPGVKFAALYWEEPDKSGHIYGPENTTAMSRVLKEVDDNIGLLVSKLKSTGLWGRINIIVTSDHGMTQLSTKRIIQLDDCIHPDDYMLVDTSPVAAILPHIDRKEAFAMLSQCHAHLRAYLKTDIPDRLHYRNNKHIQPIILVADEGWSIVQRGNTLSKLGDHGYDNSLPSMHPFMAAAGPSFREGYRMDNLKSVDIYPLMCHLLSVPPQPNNGSLSKSRCLLAAEPCGEVTLGILLMLGAVLALVTFTLLYRWWRGSRPSRSRPFQRLHVDDDEEHLLD